MQKAAAAVGTDGDDTTGTLDTDSAANKRLTKRRKWQLKWQSRRQKRNLHKETHSLDNIAEERRLKGSEGVNQLKSQQSHVANGKKWKRKAEVTGNQNERGIKNCANRKSDNVINVASKLNRKHELRKRKGLHIDKEEKAFAKMVEKYREKMEIS